MNGPLPWHCISADTDMSNNPKELSQEDVEDEGQAVVHSVQVRAEPVENPAQRSRVEESNLWANSIKFIKLNQMLWYVAIS